MRYGLLQGQLDGRQAHRPLPSVATRAAMTLSAEPSRRADRRRASAAWSSRFVLFVVGAHRRRSPSAARVASGRRRRARHRPRHRRASTATAPPASAIPRPRRRPPCPLASTPPVPAPDADADAHARPTSPAAPQPLPGGPAGVRPAEHPGVALQPDLPDDVPGAGALLQRHRRHRHRDHPADARSSRPLLIPLFRAQIVSQRRMQMIQPESPGDPGRSTRATAPRSAKRRCGSTGSAASTRRRAACPRSCSCSC